jgi:hypothetical protein
MINTSFTDFDEVLITNTTCFFPIELSSQLYYFGLFHLESQCSYNNFQFVVADGHRLLGIKKVKSFFDLILLLFRQL